MKKLINKFLVGLYFFMPIILPVLILAGAFGIAYAIATSDLPPWFKYYLLSK